MKRAVMGLFLLLLLTGCDSYVEKSKYDEAQRQLQKVTAEVDEARRQLGEVQKQNAELSVHKFSTYEAGSRTWRFDSVTGDTCVLLAPAWDWKKKETKAQSCICTDARAELDKEFLSADTPGIRESFRAILVAEMREACGLPPLPPKTK